MSQSDDYPWDPTGIFRKLVLTLSGSELSDSDLRRAMLGPIIRGMPWQQKHEVCREHVGYLHDWERTFISGLFLRHWDKDELTTKQNNKLNEIYHRLVFHDGVHHRAHHSRTRIQP